MTSSTSRSQPRPASESELREVSDIASNPAQSDNTAQQYARIQEENQRLSAQLQISQKAQEKLLVSESVLQQQAAALFQLTQSHAISQGQLDPAFKELTEVISQLIQVERVSIWLTNSDGSKIRCADLFQKTQQQHTEGVELAAKDYPVYFTAVMSTPLVAAHDARADARTNEFLEGYLDALDIYSMLDASVYVAGKVKGVICCEQVGTPRIWSSSDQTFVRSIANLVALTLETHQRQQNTQKLEQALSQLEASQIQLVQSEKMASLGNLVAGVAHEINNPVGFLKGSARNAKQYLEDLLGHLSLYQENYPDAVDSIQEDEEEIDLEFLCEDFPKLLSSMQSAAERITKISNSLRTFSRADTEYKVRVDLHDCIDSTLLILKYRLKANEDRPAIEVEKHYDNLPTVECFPGQLNQVFMNILANAVDAFDEMTGEALLAGQAVKPQTITVTTALSQDGSAVSINIQDNGKGMPASVQERVFDHLFTTKGVGKGTGLGLAIAKQIITEKHGGTLTVHSNLDQGTEFCIRLPIGSH